LDLEGSLIRSELLASGLEPDAMAAELLHDRSSTGRGGAPASLRFRNLSAGVRMTLWRAELAMSRKGEPVLSEDCLLYGFFADGAGLIGQLLKARGAPVERWAREGLRPRQAATIRAR
jgi:hypothetical protein